MGSNDETQAVGMDLASQPCRVAWHIADIQQIGSTKGLEDNLELVDNLDVQIEVPMSGKSSSSNVQVVG